MKKNFLTVAVASVLTIGFWACGDSGTDAKDNETATSSSAVESSAEEGESSSSSSIEEDVSSSSVEDESSSSTESELSSSSKKVESSSSVSLLWSWDVPKDARYNPEIEYEYMTDARDSQSYKIITIGKQTWMAENLNYDYKSGNLKGLCYDDNSDNCAVTGRLYTWAAAIDSVALANDKDDPMTCGWTGVICELPEQYRGICPEGWHLPTADEYGELIEFVGRSSQNASELKTISGWGRGDLQGKDTYGFAVLPAGWYQLDKEVGFEEFRYGGEGSFLWTATQNKGYENRAVALEVRLPGLYLPNLELQYSLSIRCVKNFDKTGEKADSEEIDDSDTAEKTDSENAE